MRTGRGLYLVLSAILASCSDADTKPEHDTHGSGGAASSDDMSMGSGGTPANPGAGDAATGQLDAATTQASDDSGAAMTDMDAGAPPVDLTGLIATSGSQLVFSSQPVADFRDYPASQLNALDLKNGKKYDLGKAELSYSYVSNDESMLFVGGANAASDSNLFIVRLTDSGIVPATPISGFAGRPGNEYLRAWSGDNRYAFFVRGSNIIGDGLDVVDTRTNSLLWSADTGLDDETASIEVAPKGTWFAYWLGTTKRTASIAHIEHDRVSSTALPIEGYSFVFDAQGTHLAYPDVDVDAGVTKLFVQTLGGAAVQIGEADGYASGFIDSFTPDGRVLVLVWNDAADEVPVIESFPIQGGDPVIIGDGTGNAPWRVPSTHFSVMLFAYTTPDSLELAFVDPAGKAPNVPVASYPADAQPSIRAIDDKRFVYTITTGAVGTSDTELHLVQLDADAKVVDARFDKQDDAVADCTDTLSHSPADKLVYIERNTHALTLVDLRGDTPQRVATLAPSLDGAKEVFCPTWGPNGDAFAYTELSATSSRIRLVRWGDGDPEAPQDVYEADEAVEIKVVRP
jgi:hypothetical protein